MNTKHINHSCLIATIIVSSLGATFSCFASESNPAEMFTAGTDVTGNTPILMPSFVPVGGGENASAVGNNASMRARNVTIVEVEVDVDLCASDFGQPSPCSAFPSVFAHVGNLKAWID